MMIQSINPYSLKQVYETREFDKNEIEKAIDTAHERYKAWKNVPFA